MSVSRTQLKAGTGLFIKGATTLTSLKKWRNKFNKIEILGTGKSISSGVSRGIVSNIDKTVDSIKTALEEVQKKNNIIHFEVITT